VEKNILYVFNKVDKVEDIEALERSIFRYEPNVLIDATSKDGAEELIEFLDVWRTNS
jgi:50S ribosomal subunit-associated GTPase HflX